MFELLVIALFVWLLVKSIGLAFRLTWGVVKILVGFLMVLALPVLVISLLFLGGIVLLVPVAMLGLAIGIMKACVKV